MFDSTDFYVEAIDLLHGTAFPAKAAPHSSWRSYLALKKASAQPGLLILGDLTIQGNIKPLYSLAEPLRMAMDNGAKRALIPIENKRNFLDVSADIMEHGIPSSTGDPVARCFKSTWNRVMGFTQDHNNSTPV